MFLSVFDMFKIGIGPSSSHTVGPMVAVGRFIDELKSNTVFEQVTAIQTTLYGSLAFTGRGHATDNALILGLLGFTPDKVSPDEIPTLLSNIEQTGELQLAGQRLIRFDPQTDIIFDYGPALPAHANGMTIVAKSEDGRSLHTNTYYSVGGGFIATERELNQIDNDTNQQIIASPYPFRNGKQMLEMGQSSGLTVAEMKYENEKQFRSEAEIKSGLDQIWTVMNACIDRGLSQDGTLPGGLKVKRRARGIQQNLLSDMKRNVIIHHAAMDWISLFAIAVNEENADGGRIVTAPTNGAAGIIPATLRYYLEFSTHHKKRDVHEFLLTAAAIGGIIKTNASISGAEVGCQGEVGSAAAMAAAGLCAVLGGSNEQIENAAEISIEHHLGMTCDPVGGLVQVPCIERNAMGAVKAVNAASLSLKGDGTHFIPLDAAIETMRQTGEDMLSKYKETSEGGLAVNITEC